MPKYTKRGILLPFKCDLSDLINKFCYFIGSQTSIIHCLLIAYINLLGWDYVNLEVTFNSAVSFLRSQSPKFSKENKATEQRRR
jgi:hypothetical protein